MSTAAAVPIVVSPTDSNLVSPSLQPETLEPPHIRPIPDREASVPSKCQSQIGVEEWVPKRRRPAKKPTSKDEVSETAISKKLVDVSVHHRFPSCLQEDFTPGNDGAWTSFVTSFEQKCAPRCPMRLALLAWSAKRSASDKLPTNPVIASWHSQASAEVDKLMALPDPMVELGVRPVRTAAEVIICASLFLNRYDQLSDNLDLIDARLQRITRWLAKHPEDLKLSFLASKLLLWTSYLETRLAIFNTRRGHCTTLLEALSQRADYHRILEASHWLHADLLGKEYPKEQLASDVERIPAALHLHETFCILAKVARFQCLQQMTFREQGGWEALVLSARSDIEANLQRLEADFELAAVVNESAGVLRFGLVPSTWHQASTVGPNSSRSVRSEIASTACSYSLQAGNPPNPETLSLASLNWLTAYAVSLTAKILWSRTAYPDMRADHTSARAAESIMQVALLLRKAHGRQPHDQTLPSALWLLPLFTAGIETTDEVRADWVRMFVLDLAEAERDRDIGRREHARKVLGLMEYVRKKQDQSGMRVSVEEAMKQMEGPNGMLMFLGQQ
ncbi:Zn(2)-C6 fungal-type domain-containing protein [Madurella fahalii]|uniref:Zn(2)-C6 fungal-type domain-containing protein n=1 Tax=Madurella fahalii TaxID=1157608 RepID=A0ABQ0G985_9PEZI